MRNAKKHRFSLHLSVAAIAISLCNAEIAMVFSINRHGARNLLQKNAYLNDSAALGGPSLLPQGQRWVSHENDAQNLHLKLCL